MRPNRSGRSGSSRRGGPSDHMFVPTRQPLTVSTPPVPILSMFAGAVRRPLARLPIGRRTDGGLTPDKRRLIEAIRQLNPTAGLKFLARFDAPALQQYLEHLNDARAKRSRPAAVRRPAESMLV